MLFQLPPIHTVYAHDVDIYLCVCVALSLPLPLSLSVHYVQLVDYWWFFSLAARSSCKSWSCWRSRWATKRSISISFSAMVALTSASLS